MSDLFEAVPNVSEGRDPLIIEACAQAISAHAKLAHQTSDAAHHRSVFTFFGDAQSVLAASLALARVAVERIDLRLHRGVHPRIGALDVLPFVPIGDTPISAAVALAHLVGEALWEELGVPSFFFGEAARSRARRILSDVRRGEFEQLAERYAAMPPDIGTAWGHESAGATAIGARPPLVAFNVELDSEDVMLARRIAVIIRERGGGFATLRALGLAIDARTVQVSLNITDASLTPLSRLITTIERQAARAGVRVRGCELIGLIPREALAEFAYRQLGLRLSEGVLSV